MTAHRRSPEASPAEGPAAPILPAHDVPVTLAFFAAVGFAVERYDDAYGFVSRKAIELHYRRTADLDPFANPHAVYIAVDDLDQVHREFVAAGLWLVPAQTSAAVHAEVRRRWKAGESIARVTEIEEKPWGIREFVLLDPDSNLLRFGERRVRVHRR